MRSLFVRQLDFTFFLFLLRKLHTHSSQCLTAKLG